MLNKEKEVWDELKKIKEKPKFSALELGVLEYKISMAFSRIDDRIKEITKSRDKWKGRWRELKNG